MLEASHCLLPPVIPYRGVRDPVQSIGSSARFFVTGSKQRSFCPNEEIFGEGQRAEYLYKIIRGTVRSYKSLSDGGRKIEAFRLRGEVFGFETGGEHSFGAEAIDDVCVLIARRFSFAETDQAAREELWRVVTNELDRVQKHALLLARNARQRLASFLLEMSQRLNMSRILDLPMSRQDIADYLGLTIETVSRKLTEFEAKGVIRRPTPQQITLVDPIALLRLAGIAATGQVN